MAPTKLQALVALTLALLTAKVTADCSVSAWTKSDCTGDFVSADGYASGCHTLDDSGAIAALSWSADCTDNSTHENTGIWASTNCDGDREDYHIADYAKRCQAVAAGRFSFGCDLCSSG